MYAPTGTGANGGGTDVERGSTGPVDASPKIEAIISRDGAPTTDSSPRVQPSGFLVDCCPNDQINFKPGGFGTYSSYFLIIAGMIGSIIAMKYAPEKIMNHKWTEGCEFGYEDACRALGAVMRFSMALVSIFSMQLLGTAVYTKFYDYGWFFKYLCFAGLVVGYFYATAHVFDTRGYAWFARIAAFFYLIFQQVVLIDFTYAWNERWVRFSEERDGDSGGSIWLSGLVIISFLIFAGSLAVIGVMFWQFSGSDCAESNAILSLTIVLPFIATAIQLFGSTEGSVLTSAIITAYATYICYSSVILNPKGVCNPTLSTGYQTVSQGIGMGITVLSMTWATRTAVKKMKEGYEEEEGQPSSTSVPGKDDAAQNPYASKKLKLLLMEISGIFLLVSAYYGMVLTNWATVQSDYNIDNPKSGRAAMWIQAAGQWIALLMYIWTLVAPRLFPDRDFSSGSGATNRAQL